ncbi:MAG TPA: multiheme c-type cytochrome [Pirellulales bacterium]|jgi:predicted CXXCH cytochrome family protein|nr:multiheme c-type cytochrome [Pirellulales bacterium]
MHRRLRLTLLVGSLLLGVWGAWRLISSRPLPSAAPEAHGKRETVARAEVESAYVGLQICAECHIDEYRSYLKTAHSRALAEIDPQAEPADGQFDHLPSGCSYRVYRDAGVFRQRQWVTTNDDPELVEDYPVKYLIGSGRHTRSYLIEDDGFLIESPITWYESRRAWGMSPGYDGIDHLGFERAVEVGCVVCHVGRAEELGGALNRIAIHEQAIGCESCHGPGSLHVARRRDAKGAATKDDAAASEMIVHPGRLSRELSESICAQCHLRSDASVFLRGRSHADFRPGHLLSDYRIDYRLGGPPERMKVVGHVEQMRSSRCYQRSDVLTCTTCHDPHVAPSPKRVLAGYRGKCLQCHAEAQCGLGIDERTKSQPGDNCLACHMPQTPTEIPHIAFTHHRIGIHGAGPQAAADNEVQAEQGIGELVPLSDLSHLPEIERDRCLGLAYLEYSYRHKQPAAQDHYRDRAVQLLESVRGRGLRDAFVDAGLARVYWTEAPSRAVQLALAALEDDPLPPSERVNALFVLGVIGYNSRQWPHAKRALEELVRLRRHPVDWTLLGLCQEALGDDPGAIQSLRRAAEINRYQRDVHEVLARLYARQGQTQLADHHRQLSQLLQQRAQERTQSK